MKKWILKIGLVFLILLLLTGAYVGYLMYLGDKISTGEKIPDYNQPKTALLVIDVQEGTTGKTSTFPELVHQSDDLMLPINFLVSFCHNVGIPVIYITQETENLVVNLLTDYVLAKGSPGAEIDERIKIVSDALFSKTVMDAFSNPALDEFLREKNINHLIITGLDASACVHHSTLAAFYRGYKITVVEDAVISSIQENKTESLKEFEELGIQIKRAAEVPKLLP